MTGSRSADLGRAGEELAAAWYLSRGYEVVARNWRCAAGELDLVCRRSHVLVVCEVKARSSERFGAPVEAVTGTKQRRLRRLAAAYLAESDARAKTVRFDVASVTPAGVEVIESAF